MICHHERAVYQAARDLLCEAARHGDVSPERSEQFGRMLQASALHNVSYLRKIDRRAARLPKLKSQVEGLPDCLDARETRIVDAHSLTAAWLAEQFEAFDERAALH
jgi:hypothetical protein